MATILVVDDRPLNREFFTTLLGYEHHRLLEAGDGAEALAVARREKPDLIVTDILMPTMDGYELVRQLRLGPRTASIPIILYTAIYEQREARSLAQSCGRCYFLAKPSEPQAVLQMVHSALRPAPASGDGQPPEEFHSEHLRLLSDTLVRKVTELQQTVVRLEQVNRELVLQKYALQSAEAEGKARAKLLAHLAGELPVSVEALRQHLARLEASPALSPADRGELAMLRREVERQAQLTDKIPPASQPVPQEPEMGAGSEPPPAPCAAAPRPGP